MGGGGLLSISAVIQGLRPSCFGDSDGISAAPKVVF